MDNNALQIILTVIGILGALGLFAAGMGFLWSKFRSGASEEKTAVISSADQLTGFWKEQAEGYKIMLETKEADWNKRFQDLTREVGEIKGQLNAETKQKNEIMAILQGRDPETKQFQEFMITTQKEIVTVLAEIHKTIKEDIDIHATE